MMNQEFLLLKVEWAISKYLITILKNQDVENVILTKLFSLPGNTVDIGGFFDGFVRNVGCNDVSYTRYVF